MPTRRGRVASGQPHALEPIFRLRGIVAPMIAKRPLEWLCFALLSATLGSCGPSPGLAKSATPAPAASSAPDSSAPAADAPDEQSDEGDDSGPLAPGKTPEARIVAVTGSPPAKVRIRFANPTPSPCTFRAYTLVWSGGKKRVEGKSFVVPPGQRRQRTLRVDPNDGKLDKLDAKSAWVDLETDCSTN